MFKPDTLIIKEAKVSEHNKIIEIFTHYNNISVCSTFISFKRMKLHIQFHFFYEEEFVVTIIFLNQNDG